MRNSNAWLTSSQILTKVLSSIVIGDQFGEGNALRSHDEATLDLNAKGWGGDTICLLKLVAGQGVAPEAESNR